MNIKYKLFSSIALVFLLFLAGPSCKKLDRPALGDFPKDDAVLPPGDLRFFTPFDLAGEEFRFKVGDSISGNPAFPTPPLTLIPGITGQGIKGDDQKAILYLNANDFAKATSFTVAFWMKNTVPTGGSPQFVFSLPNKDMWAKSSMFLLFEHTGGGATADSAVLKFYVNDNRGENWFELVGANRMTGIFDDQWHHLAFSYDETTSSMKIYRDGNLTNTLPWGGHGKFEITPTSANRFVVGGMNKHVGLEGPTDAWIQSWLGGLDQFRLYNKALSGTEIMALFNSKL